jgi:putative inorganic carbon (hco3(-)) transporter
MSSRRLTLAEAAWWAAAGSLVASVASIAVSQLLLGASLAMFLGAWARGEVKPQWPPFGAALLVFILLTLVALAASPDPRGGLPQIKKLYLLLSVPLMASLFRDQRDLRRVALGWCAVGSASALWGLGQFAVKWSRAQAAGENFYQSYVGSRITGFNSHWMTFSGQMMVVLVFAIALLFWARPSKRLRAALLLSIALCGTALVVAFTRGVWIAAGVAVLYLLWSWNRWTVVLLPIVVAAAVAFGPQSLRGRVESMVQPHGQTDSNQHRIVTWRTGWQMVKAHPWLGLGPEQVGKQFNAYVPADIPKPLPTGWYGHLHNIYLQYSAERGVPALIAWLWFFLGNGWTWVRILRRGADDSAWMLHGAVAMLIGLLVTGLFEHNLGDSEILLLALGTTAAVTAAARTSSAPRRPAS